MFTCIQAEFTCACVISTYIHTETKLHVCGYIFTYMYTKFTVVCTPSLHVCVYIFTYNWRS